MADKGQGSGSEDMDDSQDEQPAATFELTEASKCEREEQEALLQEFELRRKIRATVVPTDDGKVREMLRALGEPITLFGEREMERRDRLRKLVAEREAADMGGLPSMGAIEVVEEEKLQTEVFYTEGTEELLGARKGIAQWSLRRAAARTSAAKRRKTDEGGLQAAKAARAEAEHAASRLAQQSSELGGERPISGCTFSPDGSTLATCSWSGMVNLWSSQNCARQGEFRAHAERCTDVKWHPAALVTLGREGGCLATGSADCTGAIWSADGAQLRKLEGHTDRLARVAWHPMGRHLATASFDMTWRLWDAETGTCLLEQEGHSRSVYAVAFHPDGSLAASAGLDAIGRVWDCRTGRSIITLEGHVKQILSADFAPDGWRLATGSGDNSVRVWDLRKRGACLYNIPAHRSMVSTVRWQPDGGHTLLSAGYDNVAKVWSGRDYSLIKVLAGHEGRLMAADLTCEGQPGGMLVGTASFDKTIKLWAPEEELPDLDMVF